ncbi:MAG: two-component regulator propeller domain-containing protein [Flavobacteriaceae bacterium]
MKKNLIVFLLFLLTVSLNAQDYSALWEGHFSYLNVKDVVYGNDKIYAASENVVFVYDIQSTEIETITTINGLSGEFISTIHYSEVYNLLIIGYENGLIEVYNESDNSVLTVVDIIEKPTIPPDNKKINHFNEYNNVVYISTDYGISVYDLERLEFGDTYFVGNGGSQIIVSETAVFGDNIYAACLNGRGLLRALVASDGLIDYQEWTQTVGGNFFGIQQNQDKLYTIRGNNTIYEVVGATIAQLFTYNTLPIDIKSSNNNLVVTTNTSVFVYDQDFSLLATSNIVPEFDTQFTSAVTTNEGIYIGTSGYGVLRSTIDSASSYTEIHPNGPLRNNVFSVEAGFSNVWATYGAYTLTYFPLNRRYGVSHLQEEEWFNIPYDSLQFPAFSLNYTSINPFKPQQVFISSFQHGLLEIENNEVTNLYNHLNSGMESLVIPGNPNVISIRVTGSTFDREGLLWTLTGRVQRPLKSYNPNTGQWVSYDFSEILPDPLTDEFGYSDVVIDANNTKWIGGYKLGLIGFNENGGNHLLKFINDEVIANLPSSLVRALAIDKQNQLWIGTTKGLRVLYNTSNFFEDETVSTREIVILEDGIPKELLEQQFISDIIVDGSNNKWVATIGAGVFYFSSNGQETIFHFTKDNSPLPSNNVNDMALDSNNGIMYFGTERGLVAFRSGGSETQNELVNAHVYPNPVRPGFDMVNDKIKIKDISDNVNIKITDIEGNLVAEAESRTNLRYRGYNLEIDGGTAYWNGKNLSNNQVASGVYLVMLSDLDTFETKVLKLMIIR